MKIKDQGKTSLGMDPNLAAALSYLGGFITGIIFYIFEKENKFVRFHALQSILVFGSFFVLTKIAGVLPSIGAGLVKFLQILNIILWVFLMIKAYQGEYFKVPFFGNIARKRFP
jgi:uncharacterized membrane protein